MSVLVILAVALGLSLGERSPPRVWARVWAGPTEGPTPLSLRVEQVEADPTSQYPIDRHARIRITDEGGSTLELPLVFDAEGAAFVTLGKPAANPMVTIFANQAVLASGPIRLTRENFWKQRHVRGGWWRGKSEGSLNIAVGCREGVLAHGRPGVIGIGINDAAGKPVETDLTVDLEGLSPAAANLHTDALGRVAFEVRPTDLSASIRVLVGSSKHPVASYFSSIPIETTALSAHLSFGHLFVDSHIPLERVYYSLVNEQGRWAAGSLELACVDAVDCRGRIEPPIPIPSPAWLMLGTEPNLDGPNVVGWPIQVPNEPFVAESITVRDQLLLDGKSAVTARLERERAKRFTRVLAGAAVAGAVLSLLLGLRLRDARRAAAQLAQHLEPERANSLVRPSALQTLLLVALVVTAIVALVYWAKIRLAGG